ncbi:Type 3 restriction-modification system methylation subunit [Salmonella enterica subsp. enterica serovar Hvittingfoss str. A4-620]|nr:Type 3 restriction-modification system methylation subunit [Salmonella enterica subsp. enterica serovar Hvittingfoss str. A4-620]
MDEIFGEGGFVTNVMWKRKKEISNDSDNVSIQGEYILVYAKTGQGALRLEPLSKEYIQKSYKEPTEQFPEGKWRPVPLTVSKGLSGGGYTYKITTPNGTVHERLWAYPEASYQKLVADNLVYFGKDNGGIPQRVMYAHHSKGQPTTNYWDNVASNKEGKKEILDLFGDNVFDTPKPTALLKKIIKLAIDKDGVVLDFFAGSGTTAHAVMALNEEDGGQRTFILCTIDQTLSNNTIAKKAGYNTIDEISRERITRVAAKIRANNPATNSDLGFKHYRFATPTQQTLDDLDSFDIATGHFINTSGQLAAFTESGFTDMINPFSARGLGVPGGASGEETLLTTWLVADGYKMDIDVQTVDFSGYCARYVDNTRLYLIDERWGTEQTRDLLNHIGTHQLPVQTIVIYGYSFDLESIRELEIGLKQLDQKVNLVKRY